MMGGGRRREGPPPCVWRNRNRITGARTPLRREGTTLRVDLRDGTTRTLRLRTLRNRDELFAALCEAASERGIPSAAPAPLPAG